MKKILSQKYFLSRNTVKIAKSLLGKFLVRRRGRKIESYMVTEVEAYDGFKDRASHAHRGKTERNKIMFGKAGHWYVYFTYGMHHMLNIVTGPKNYPAAILIRSIRVDPCLPAGGRVIDPSQSASILNGPAKLTKYLKIDKKFNGKLADKKTDLWIKDGGIKIKPIKIKSASRIGVNYAGPVWGKKKYRFFIKIPN